MGVFFVCFFGNVFIDEVSDQNPENWKIFTTILSSRDEVASIIYKLEVYLYRALSFNGFPPSSLIFSWNRGHPAPGIFKHYPV